jgi:hypothetical protein
LQSIISPSFLGFVLPFLLTVLLPFVGVYYAHKIRRIYPRLSNPDPKYGCPICGEKIKREKFTSNVFLLPYAFKTLRHWETHHSDISKYARRLRLTLTSTLLLATHCFSAVWGFEEVWMMVSPGMSLVEAVPYFLVPYLSIQLIIWAIISYLLLVKKGKIFETGSRNSRSTVGGESSPRRRSS